MSKIVTDVFDGQVLRPDIRLDYNLASVMSDRISTESESTGDAWEVLKAFAGTVEAPADWSIEHDHYLYGTVKDQLEPMKERENAQRKPD